MVTTQQTRITCRRDIDDVLADIESEANTIEEEARNDVTLDISQVFQAAEMADTLRSAAATLDQLVMLPIDLYEDVWSVLDAVESLSEEGKLPTRLRDMANVQSFTKLLDRLSQYNIR
jgi:hypothetical protein